MDDLLETIKPKSDESVENEEELQSEHIEQQKEDNKGEENYG